MNTANDDSANGYLFNREVEEIENVVMRQPDLDLTFSQVFAAKQLANPEAELSKYSVADDDVGSAKLLRKLSDYPRMSVSGSEVSSQIYKVGIAFEIPTEDVENSRRWSRPLDTEFAERATRKVDEKLIALAFVGDTDFGVAGVLELSGVTTYSGTSLNNSSLNLTDELTNSINAIPVRFRSRPYSLVIADQEWKRLVKIGNSFSNQTWLEMFKSAHPNISVVKEANLDALTALAGGGSVASGTALLVPKDKELCRMPIGMLGKLLFNQADPAFAEKVEGKVKARVGAVEAPFPTSIVKITGWA